MPIYEFYCEECNTLFNFFSAAVDTTSRPLCPACGEVRLERRPARFATLKHRGDSEAGPMDALDDERVAGVMDSVMEEMGDLGEGEEDPRTLARIFRRFGEASGLELGPKMEEVMHRLEQGEDPDRLEEEMGDDFGDDESMEDLFRLRQAAAGRRRARRPRVDETLYFL